MKSKRIKILSGEEEEEEWNRFKITKIFENNKFVDEKKGETLYYLFKKFYYLKNKISSKFSLFFFNEVRGVYVIENNLF